MKRVYSVATTRSRVKKKTKVPTGYDSKLEYDLHTNELKDWDYHPRERVSYAVPSTYEPDFVTEVKWNKDCQDHAGGCNACTKCVEGGCNTCTKTVLVEVKGRFRTRQEATKYIYVRESLREATFETGKEQELVFLFQDASKTMPFAARRKDGTKQTHGEWATKNKFTHHCIKTGGLVAWLETLT
jgi:hypothetical protein